MSSQRLSQMTVFDGLSFCLPVKRWPDKRCWFLKHKRVDWLVQTLQSGYLSAFQLWHSTLLLWQAKTPVDSNCGWLTNWYENKYCHDMEKIIPREIIHLPAHEDLNMVITSTGNLHQYTVLLQWYHCIGTSQPDCNSQMFNFKLHRHFRAWLMPLISELKWTSLECFCSCRHCLQSWIH